MILQVNKVNKCRDNDCGNFRTVSKDIAIITISLSENKLLAEYGATLLHELLHFWMVMLRREGLKIADRTEHSFVYAAEGAVIKVMRKYFKRVK